MSFSIKTNNLDILKPKNSIRSANDKDIDQIADTIVSSFYSYSGILAGLQLLLRFTISEDLRYRLNNKPPLHKCLVATTEEDNNSLIIGTVEISLRTSFWAPAAQYPYVSNLAVRENYRRQGLASKLLQKCDQIACSWGYDRVQLHVLEENRLALKLYLDSGYQIIKRERQWSSLFYPGSTRILLRKKLSKVNSS